MDKLDTEWFEKEDNIKEARKELEVEAEKSGDNAVRAVVNFLCASLRCSTTPHLKAFKDVLQDNLVKWKGHDKEVCEVLHKFRLLEEKSDDDERWYNSAVADAAGQLVESTKPCHKKIRSDVVKLVVFALNKGSETYLHLAKGITWEHGFKDMLEKVPGNELQTAMDAFLSWLKSATLDPEGTTCIAVANRLSGQLSESAKNMENMEKVAEILNYCSEKELRQEDEPDRYTVYGEAIDDIFRTFFHKNKGRPDYLKLVMPVFVRLLGDEDVSRKMNLPIKFNLLQQQGEVLGPHADPILDAFINNDADYIVVVLPELYQHNPAAFTKRLPELVKKMDDVPPEHNGGFYRLLHQISTTKPQAVIPHIDKLEEGLEDPYSASYALQAMKEICKYDAKPFLDKIDKLEAVCKSSPVLYYFIYDVLSLIGLYNEEYAERIMALLTDKLMNGETTYQTLVLMFMKTVGGRYKSVLEKRRPQLTSLLKSTQPGVSECVQPLLDYLDDRSLMSLEQDIQEQQEEVDKLDERVTETEEKVDELQDDVSDQRQQLGEVKEDVQQQGEKLTELEYVVDETVEKVEEIDHKTLSAAPAWSRDVSLLMNEEGDYDWRFLAVRLGYGPEDIRAWATNADPTMAMLNEWYNTHRSSEATYTVVNQSIGNAAFIVFIAKLINLANLLNKPIIPLLVENTPWPPPGSMSMIFSQLLYIMFHGASSSSGKFWPDSSFYELLGQLAYHAAPDQDLITDEYRNWSPVVGKQEEKESNPETKETTSTPRVEGKENIEPVLNAEVFLSYQWGHQPQVKALYSQLTSQGFPCWMDIQQMGGGDALYGKIDKGIRNAKVLVCCVTPKYALSPNCRREVSLADALRKPIVPLLLEDTSWPPEGPMSMAFTELLYIDCRDDRTQNDWQGDKFEELMLQVSQYAKPAPKSVLPSIKPAEQNTSNDADRDRKAKNMAPTESPAANGKAGTAVKTTAKTQPKPIATVQPTPTATIQPTPIATVQPTPITTVQPTPIAAVQPTPTRKNPRAEANNVKKSSSTCSIL